MNAVRTWRTSFALSNPTSYVRVQATSSTFKTRHGKLIYGVDHDYYYYYYYKRCAFLASRLAKRPTGTPRALIPYRSIAKCRYDNRKKTLQELKWTYTAVTKRMSKMCNSVWHLKLYNMQSCSQWKLKIKNGPNKHQLPLRALCGSKRHLTSHYVWGMKCQNLFIIRFPVDTSIGS